MKRLLVSLMTLAAIGAQADDFTYKYLVVTASDGSQTNLPTSGLQIAFADGKLIATTSDGTVTLETAQLASMQFAETASTTAISTLGANSANEGPVEVYSLSGVRLGQWDNTTDMRNALNDGVYIVKQNNSATKITVRK